MKKLLYFTFLLYLGFTGNAQDTTFYNTGNGHTAPYGYFNWNWNTAAYQRFTYSSPVDFHKVPYRLLTPPNNDPTKKYPLFVMLHGGGEGIGGPCDAERGPNECQLVWGGKIALDSSNKYPSFVLFPQTYGAWWGNAAGADYTYSPQMEPPMRCVVEIIENILLKNHNIDPDRIYLAGLSAGGKAAWELLERRPDLFAATTPFCGMGSPLEAKKLINNPIWNYQGGQDNNPNPFETKRMYDSLVKNGGNPKRSLYVDRDHWVWVDAYNSNNWMSWIYAQNKKNIHILYNKAPNICNTGQVALGISYGFLQYQWQINGTNIPGANQYVYNATQQGTYTVNYQRKDGSWGNSNPVYINGCGGQSPYNGIAWSIPGKIEAEKYDFGGNNVAYRDLTSGNVKGTFRTDDVDIETCSDLGGGYNIAATQAGEWLEYSVHVTASNPYNLHLRLASTTLGNSLHLELNGVNISGNIPVPNTGGWQIWQTVTVKNVNLPAGTHVLRVHFDTKSINLNYMEAESVSLQTAFTGGPWPVPGRIQAENYDFGGNNVAYKDLTPGNSKAAFRNEDVDIELCYDLGGTYNLAAIEAGEWTEYTLQVGTTGNYIIHSRVASTTNGNKLHYEINGINVSGSIPVPNTTGWQSYQTVSSSPVALSSGTHVLRLFADTRGFNVNYIDISSANSARVGENEVSYSANYEISSNPFIHATSVKITDEENLAMEVFVYDVAGKIVYQSSEHITNKEFSLGDQLREGMYFLHVSYKNKTTSIKIIKKSNEN